jgi:hypothetical protein
MAPSSVSEVRPHGVEVAVTHVTATTEFVDLVLADDELARGEFEAIVAAGWGGHVPRWPTSRGGAWWPREPVADQGPGTGRGPRDPMAAYDVVAHERGPPRGRA